MEVEVVYALPGFQALVRVQLPTGATAAEAVVRSGLLAAYPEIAWPGAPLGIFGMRVAQTQVLLPGDRVEIYRPLTLDPKERRRRRARRAGGADSDIVD